MKLEWLGKCLLAGVALAVLAGSSSVGADDSEDGKPVDIELFAGLEQGVIAAKVVPNSFFMVALTLQNQSSDVVNVKTPEVFAAVATKRLAAWRAAAQRGRSQDDYASFYDRGGSQSLGGSFYYHQPQPSESGSDEAVAAADGAESAPALPQFVLQPRQRITVKIPTFCMEFGLPDPSPRISYTLVPLSMVTRKPEIKNLLIEFGRRKPHQAIAQLAMWRVANETPWRTLTTVRWPGRLGRVTPAQLQAAGELVEQIERSSLDSENGEP